MTRQAFRKQIAVLDDVVAGEPEGRWARLQVRLLCENPDVLADDEILEIILLQTLPRRRARSIAQLLLAEFCSYPNVLSASVAELLRIKGLGEAEAAALKVVHAAAIRLVGAEVRDQPVFSNWNKLMQYLNALLAREKVEQFRVLFLDARNRLLGDEMLSRGTPNHTSIYPRQILVRALELHALALILVHNHPGGDPAPSRDDVALTKEIQLAAAPLDILILDHVIIGNGRWTSLQREGLLSSLET